MIVDTTSLDIRAAKKSHELGILAFPTYSLLDLQINLISDL